jgi:hypothetical protein
MERRPPMIEVAIALIALIALDIYVASMRHSRGD